MTQTMRGCHDIERGGAGHENEAGGAVTRSDPLPSLLSALDGSCSVGHLVERPKLSFLWFQADKEHGLFDPVKDGSPINNSCGGGTLGVVGERRRNLCCHWRGGRRGWKAPDVAAAGGGETSGVVGGRRLLVWRKAEEEGFAS